MAKRKRWVVGEKSKEENLAPDPGEFGPQKTGKFAGVLLDRILLLKMLGSAAGSIF